MLAILNGVEIFVSIIFKLKLLETALFITNITCIYILRI